MTAEGLPRGSLSPREHYIEAMALLQHAVAEWAVEQRHVKREEQITTLVLLSLAHSALGLLGSQLVDEQDHSLDQPDPWVYDEARQSPHRKGIPPS